MDKSYSIQFPDCTNERYWKEAEWKGWLKGAIIHIQGVSYECEFYDLTRLAQDCEYEFGSRGYMHEPNLIIVPKVTEEYIRNAVDKLSEANFEGLLPCTQ